VVGLRDLDAGKTTFAQGVLRTVWRQGEEPVPFKPWSASSLWQHHDAVTRALEGDLASRDARRLLAAAGRDADPRLVNPVHRVWRPRSALEAGRGNTVPLLDRVADDDGVAWVVHGDGDLPEPLPGLVADASRVERAPDDDALRALQAELHVPAVEAAWERLDGTGWVLTESYSDVARPPGFPGVPDVTLAVEPGRVHRFDGTRWDKALDLRTGVRGGSAGAEPASPELLDLVSPEASSDLPPLADAERTDLDAVEEAYREAIEAVLPEATDEE
jgi:predicted P-loop ATPase/GTPase